MARERIAGGRYKNTGGIKDVPNEYVTPGDRYFRIDEYDDKLFTFERRYAMMSSLTVCQGCWVYEHIKHMRGKLCSHIDCVDDKNSSYMYKVIEAE